MSLKQLIKDEKGLRALHVVFAVGLSFPASWLLLSESLISQPDPVGDAYGLLFSPLAFCALFVTPYTMFRYFSDRNHLDKNRRLELIAIETAAYGAYIFGLFGGYFDDVTSALFTLLFASPVIITLLSGYALTRLQFVREYKIGSL